MVVDAQGTYSFCETVAAHLWHIRVLSSLGVKYGGGADTPTLCGLDAAWDLHAKITDKTLNAIGICRFCREKYIEATDTAKE